MNGYASVTYIDWGFKFSHQVVLEYGAGFNGLHKLKCLKQATGKVDQWMRESLLDVWSATGHDAGMSCHFCTCDQTSRNQSTYIDILLVDRRSNISNRRLSCEKLLASGQETVPDGTTLWGYGLVKLTSYSRTSQSRSGCGSCTYTIWSLFWEGKSVLCLCRWSFWASFDQRFDRSAKATNSVRKMMQHWHCTAVQL